MAIELYSKATLDTLLAEKLSVISLSNGQAGALDPAIPTNGMALTFDSTYGLKWATVTASAAWGGITGTVTDQTDLTTYLSGAYYPLSGNPSGFLTSVPGKTISSLTSNAYTLVAGDANNIVYVPPGASGGFPPVNISVPDDATYSFAIGTVITVVVNNVTGASDVNLVPLGFGVPTLLGTVQIPSGSTSGIMELIKVAGDTWICGKLS
jgi:hypothetical protein